MNSKAFLYYKVLLASSAFCTQSAPKSYEARTTVDMYLAFHYCPAEEYMVYSNGPKQDLDFPKRRQHWSSPAETLG